MKLSVYGENSLIIFFDDEPSNEQALFIRKIDETLYKELDYLIDSIASYNTLVIFYDINKISYKKTIQDISAILEKQKIEKNIIPNVNNHKIFVCYEDILAPDINRVIQHNNINKEELIRLHTKKTYTVYSVGFMPNFAYMGILENKIATPRLKKPRAKVLSGSVGIAQNQTGIYTQISPGGWNIIGRTAQNLQINGGIKFLIGDTVNFTQISLEKYIADGGKYE